MLATKELKNSYGVMITASHNPKEYNGFNVSIYTKDSPSYINFTNQQRIAFPILNSFKVINILSSNNPLFK